MDTMQPVELMRERITDEIFLALGINRDGALRKLLGGLFRRPTLRFSGIFARADQAIGQAGISAGCHSVVKDLQLNVHARGAETLPREGPLLVVSNHPGAYDSVCLGSVIDRGDLRILVYETAFYHAMPNANKRFIYANDDPATRTQALRQAVQHLQEGGALLQFGSGLIEPDPELVADCGDTFQDWSSSLEIMLRKAPQTSLVLAMASGVQLARFAHHPLTVLRRNPKDKRRIAEFMQVIQHLLRPGWLHVDVHLSFAPPVWLPTLQAESSDRRLMPAVLARAQALLAEHQRVWAVLPG